MALHTGRGFAAINYPIGMNLGGDPSQALVHSNPDGKFTVALSAIDLGQGMKSVTRQIAAETLGVPVEDVYVDTADSDTGPHDMGSFASRGTHRMGNAVIMNGQFNLLLGAVYGGPHQGNSKFSLDDDFNVVFPEGISHQFTVGPTQSGEVGRLSDLS